MRKPVVLVSADVKPIEGFDWHAAISSYLDALVHGADAMPVLLPALGPALDLDSLLDRVDGVLLTGSRSNVHPSLYGGDAHERNGPFDTRRDATTLPLIRRALARHLPLFAICRGLQELNVALGGTLVSEVQDIDGRRDHRAPESDSMDERFALAHHVDIVPGGRLAAVLGDARVEVNSLHRQAIGALAPGLTIEAQAEDSTIEAVSVDAHPGFALATQWHPEYWVGSDSASARLFAAFGEAARAQMTATARSAA
ncbi:gamma-glutamyl-gamma-aminobutyrate hydrolase family protein [Stappia taiwanensis]|uniref:gamma-glutamyl-gamma-aminobutyrate hydrolase n=1 Tax=Stappia taiwanensis TaxID=992267 RepID=A0A838XRJ4_9HYPH|nr:gamma-glutamyl-gamma-aminobutyrate hydrolase family protein [Stappia taiwanensis]MBA4612377.1 gamma-glutamyl-gamma-aminobutyrate hydrolase family protein [Stappia taiwanensis]GGF04906.1 gamma-glutamyl-gamma-aminobutyrate hydrolase [Stappia taiwanensis]